MTRRKRVPPGNLLGYAAWAFILGWPFLLPRGDWLTVEAIWVLFLITLVLISKNRKK